MLGWKGGPGTGAAGKGVEGWERCKDSVGEVDGGEESP